ISGAASTRQECDFAPSCIIVAAGRNRPSRSLTQSVPSGDPHSTCFRTVFLAAALSPPVSFRWARAGERPPPAEPAPPEGLWTRDTLTGGWGGLRPALAERGLAFAFNYIGETLATVRGAQRRLAIYEGRLEMTFEADLEKAIGWPGGTFHVTGYQIHGRGLSANALSNLLTASGIEAERSSRLFTLWLEQAWAGKKVSLRVGQLAADDEFAISTTAATFANSTFGWPGILAANLTS